MSRVRQGEGRSATGTRGSEPVSQSHWRELVGEIAELEELLGDLRDQSDALAVMNRHRLEAMLEAKRTVLKTCDVGGFA